MRILNGRDTAYALITGFTTGLIASGVLQYVERTLPLGISRMALVVLVPVAWLVGIQFGYFLAIWFRPMAQFGKFAAIGFTNAAVDFGVLYLFIGLTGYASGIAYALFKALSFSVATLHSYFWNKYWAFDAGRGSANRREVGSFVAVSLVSLAINVGVASAVVGLGPLGGLTHTSWAGVGAVAGSAAALTFSFTGFRMFVFRKK